MRHVTVRSGFLFLLPVLAVSLGAAEPRERETPEPAAKGSSEQADKKREKLLQRESEKLRAKVKGGLRKGQGNFFALMLIENQYHTEVTRTVVENVVVNGRAMQHEQTEFRTGGEYLPVPTAKFQVAEGPDAATDAVVEHLAKYVQARAPKRKRRDAPVGPPPLSGDWYFVGRYKDQAAADAAVQQAQSTFEASPRWRVSGEQAARAAE